MEAYGKTLFWISEENLILEVPFFQRPYVWDEENWQTLISSIKNANGNSMPFIGSVILQEKSDNLNWVIDGQQRLTTLSLLIKALLDFYKTLSPKVRSLFEGIIYNTEVANIDSVINEPRIIPSYSDKEDYLFLMAENISQDELEKKNSNIINCYKYFTNYFSSISESELKSFASKLLTKDKYVISIILNKNDDEQEIFDTVNSLGKKLTNSDIVKNYLYQQMKNYVKDNTSLVQQVLSHYKKYWDKVFIEGERRNFWDMRISLGRIQTTNLDAFLKDYGTIKGIYVPSESGGFEGLAKQYKKYINTLDFDKIQEFSKDLSSYAEIYFSMKTEYENCNDFRIDNVLNTTLLILNKLEISTFNPYVLKLIKNQDSNINSKLFNLQRFILKRFIWKASIKNYNKVCQVLLTTDDDKTYLDSYNDQTNDAEWDYFPNGLRTIKNSPATLILFIIEMIRRHEKGEDKYSDTLLYNKTLEHIMPQKWEKNWGSVDCYILNSNNDYELVTDYDQKVKTRKSKIYSIGNMTLLSSKLNTSISNETLQYKIEGKTKPGIKSFVGTLSVAQEIVDHYYQNKLWDERCISEREVRLFNELNDYYMFVTDVIVNRFDEENKSTIDLADFNDNTFVNKKVGALAKDFIQYGLMNNLFNDEDIKNLLCKEYSNLNTGCAFPVLTLDEKNTFDSNGRRRYYKQPIEINGKKFYICKEWFEGDRKKLVPWMKKYLNK